MELQACTIRLDMFGSQWVWWGGWWTLGLIVPPGPFPSVVTLKIVKRDEFSTKCNQTDHHRMSGGRQEVSPGVEEGGCGKMFVCLAVFSRGREPGLLLVEAEAWEVPSFGTATS